MIVRLYYKLTCPRCDTLLEELERASITFGFEFEPVLIDDTFEPFYTKDPASKIYDEEWIQKFGSEKQKKLYREAKEIFDLLHESTVAPVLEIRWNHGASERAIVIKGFREENMRKAMTNIIATILSLLKLERRVLGHVERPRKGR